MTTIRWKGYEWITEERWGQIHPEKPDWWYDESCVLVDNEDNLNLMTKRNPKYFPGLNKTAVVGAGLVSCTEKFDFGMFKVIAKLPEGSNLWPAFWMWSWDTWPPEIDVFEGYSDSKGSYLKPRISNPLGFWNVQTNLHYIKNGQSKMVGGKTHYFGFKDPSKNFMEYAVSWKKDKIEFYYNNRLVRVMDDEKILKQLSETKMNVIINNGVTSDVDLSNPPHSNFVVKDFTYTPY